MSVIFPEDDTKISLAEFERKKTTISKILSQDVLFDKDIEKIKQKIGEIEGYLIVAEKKKKPEYAKAFENYKILDIFNQILEKNNPNLSFTILESIYFLFSNLKTDDLLTYIYKVKFKTKIEGLDMNIIDKLISLNEERHEEFLTYQINCMKSLTQRLDAVNVVYFFDREKNLFPLVSKSLSLYNHTDAMFRNHVKNILLTIIKIKYSYLSNFMISYPNNLYYINLILNFKNSILQYCYIDLSDYSKSNLFDIFKKKQDELVDMTLYIGDLLNQKIPQINFIVLNCFLNEILLPLFKIIISRNREIANLQIVLYIFTLIIYNIKNKFLNNSVSYIMFSEQVQQSLLKFIYDYNFQFMNVEYMAKINYIIKNNFTADINDKVWKEISAYINNVSGVDFSTGTHNDKCTYSQFKKILKSRYGENFILNEVLSITKQKSLYQNNEMNLLIFNLFINTIISYYSDNNNLTSNDHLDGFYYNPLYLHFFGKDETSFENKNYYLIILLQTIQSNNNFRVGTYEILLYNVQLLIDLILKKTRILDKKEEEKIDNKKEEIKTDNKKAEANGKDNEQIKNKIISGLINTFNIQIQKVKNLYNYDPILWKSSYLSFNQAYERCTRDIEKKMTDFITLPFVLVPLEVSHFYEDVPEHLREVKTNEQKLYSLYTSIIILHDMIAKLRNKDLIKSKAFPIQSIYKKYFKNKEIIKEELGQDYAHCNLVDEKGEHIKHEIFLTGDTFYMGEIMSKNFEDLSTIKIDVKIPFRNLVVNPSAKDDEILEIYEAGVQKEPKYTFIHCLNADNTARMFNYLLTQKKNCQILEHEMLMSYIEDLVGKINNS